MTSILHTESIVPVSWVIDSLDLVGDQPSMNAYNSLSLNPRCASTASEARLAHRVSNVAPGQMNRLLEDATHACTLSSSGESLSRKREPLLPVVDGQSHSPRHRGLSLPAYTFPLSPPSTLAMTAFCSRRSDTTAAMATSIPSPPIPIPRYQAAR